MPEPQLTEEELQAKIDEAAKVDPAELQKEIAENRRLRDEDDDE